jgi:hypothetical protein
MSWVFHLRHDIDELQLLGSHFVASYVGRLVTFTKLCQLLIASSQEMTPLCRLLCR